MATQQVVGHMLDGREIGWRMIGSHTAFVIPEDAIHQPVHTFHGPVAPYDITELVGAVS